MRSTLVTLALIFSCIFLFLAPDEVEGVRIKPDGKVEFADQSEMQIVPRSFCVTEDGLYLIPDHIAGHIRIFELEGKKLKLVKKFGPQGFGDAECEIPNYCFYDEQSYKFGVIDVGIGPRETRKTLIFDRVGKVDFEPVGIVPGADGFDIRIGGSGTQLIISGYVTHNDKSYELYSVNVANPQQKDYLLQSHEKYGLDNEKEYRRKYFDEQELPAIGIEAFIDTYGDDVYYVWTGKLDVTKINLKTKEKTVFTPKKVYYIEPSEVSSKLLTARRARNFVEYNQIRSEISFVRDIFATDEHVFVVYERRLNQGNFRVQVYTPEGKFIDDIVIPGNPAGFSYRNMWFDKGNYKLYSLVTKPNKKAPQILIYQVIK